MKAATGTTRPAAPALLQDVQAANEQPAPSQGNVYQPPYADLLNIRTEIITLQVGLLANFGLE